MPHITIEVTAALAQRIDWPPLLQRLHHALAAPGWAALDDLKSRVLVCHAASSGDDPAAQQLIARLLTTNPRPDDVLHAMAQATQHHLQSAIAALQHEGWVQCCVFIDSVPKARYLKLQWHQPTAHADPSGASPKASQSHSQETP